MHNLLLRTGGITHFPKTTHSLITLFIIKSPTDWSFENSLHILMCIFQFLAYSKLLKSIINEKLKQK